MWASRDILEPLCMLAAKMTLQTMNEDTAAVLAALVMAQQLGLEEAANASPQSQYDMVQLVKKKVKSYSGITLQSNMQVLPASAPRSFSQTLVRGDHVRDMDQFLGR